MFDKPTEKSEFISIPMVPIRDVVLFPHMMIPFVIGRGSSVKALKIALAEDSQIFLATQIDASLDDPKPKDIYTTGTVAKIVQNVGLPDGNIKVLVEGIKRARAVKVLDKDGFLKAVLDPEIPPELVLPIDEILSKKVMSLFEQYVKLSQHLNDDTTLSNLQGEEIARLSDNIAANLSISIEAKQELLEEFDPIARLNRLVEILSIEVEKMNLDQSINSNVKRQMEKAQKEYYLNEKMKAIQKELGRDDKQEIDELKKKIKAAGMPKDSLDKAMQELKRLEMMSPMSAESTVSRTYIDWLLSVPWKKSSREVRSIEKAEKILEADHYGLEKIKERILEFLSIRKLVKNPKGSILCFVGPPGVGKSSLAGSIARATGRRFVRLSLGGVRDEAEIRGHRRTYIGALPGQILQMMKKAGTKNPVFLLDEVDKMSMDFRGDPSSALMEVLDPEQNRAFVDHYLDVEYDLSQVMFIATANVLHTIPQPLQDRMEVIRISGYTEIEKVEIAKRYLIKKQIQLHGLSKKNLMLSDEAIAGLIQSYTREAGVRNMEREIASVCRKVARKVVKEGKKTSVEISPENLNDYLGVIKYRKRRTLEKNEVGFATGLAWTEVGGEVLETEAILVEGKGRLTLTGKLGEIMQESAKAAMSYIRSRAKIFRIPSEFHRNFDMHVHVPEGAIPKDGPSAGITIATALISALTKIPVRADVAMTGEITLRGTVLPIGGLKEKLLAARRVNIKVVIVPKDNQKDLADIPPNIQEYFSIHFVEHMDEVLKVALEYEIPVNEEKEDKDIEEYTASMDKDFSQESITH